MSRTSTYLNFPHNTEEVFNFYKSVFGGNSATELRIFNDIPDLTICLLWQRMINLIMHIEIKITGGHILPGTDVPQESMGLLVNFGNNISINLEPDTREKQLNCLTYCLRKLSYN